MRRLAAGPLPPGSFISSKPTRKRPMGLLDGLTHPMQVLIGIQMCPPAPAAGSRSDTPPSVALHAERLPWFPRNLRLVGCLCCQGLGLADGSWTCVHLLSVGRCLGADGSRTAVTGLRITAVLSQGWPELVLRREQRPRLGADINLAPTLGLKQVRQPPRFKGWGRR